MNHIIFDIETGPIDQPYLDLMMPEFEAPKNFTDPEKIAKAIEAKKQDWYEKAALSPLTGKVIAIGLEFDVGFGIMSEPVHSKESEILTEFWKLVRDNHTSQFIGFNIASFDLPFLIRRSMKYGIRPPDVFNNNRYLSHQFVDLLQVWQCGDRSELVSLGKLAMFMGVGSKEGSGAEFAKLWKEDRPMAIEYLKQDIALTKAVAVKMGVIQDTKEEDDQSAVFQGPELVDVDVEVDPVKAVNQVTIEPETITSSNPAVVVPAVVVPAVVVEEAPKQSTKPIEPPTTQQYLADVLDIHSIEYMTFRNYVNVNGVDRRHGFDVSGYESLDQWPDKACLAIGNDVSVMARVVKRFGRK
jgi:hypothetical protein